MSRSMLKLVIVMNVLVLLLFVVKIEHKKKIEKFNILKRIGNNLSLVRFTQNVTKNIKRDCLFSHYNRVRRMWPRKASGNAALPTDNTCFINQTVAIVIPYRNRQEHLSALVNNLHVFLSNKNFSYTIFVIELAQPTRFNRGLLLNAGYVVAKQLGKFECYVFHDVDLIPMDDRIPYGCRHNPLHMASGSSKFDGKMPYKDYFGGVTTIKQQLFEQINGFSNAYFGWGGEDDDILRRFTANNISIERLDPSIGRYFALAHDRDEGNPLNNRRFRLLEKALERTTDDGISSLSFKISSFYIHQLYLLYLIDIVE